MLKNVKHDGSEYNYASHHELAKSLVEALPAGSCVLGHKELDKKGRPVVRTPALNGPQMDDLEEDK